MITYIFRKRSPTVFSIENQFDRLYERFHCAGEAVRRVELPYVSSGIVSVLRNAWFVAKLRDVGILHITGDVHYATLLRPFSKTIITIHDCVVMQRGSGFKRFVLRVLWFELPLRLAAFVVTISDRTKREVLHIVPVCAQKIDVIANFVDPIFTFIEQAVPKSAPRILHVGTTPNKNLSKVVAALRGIDCVLVIVGRLSATLLNELRDSGLRYENVFGLSQADITREYQDADIISFPSTYEGFGMPILEAQTVGRAVLTSDLEPMRTVAGAHGALLVDPGSVDSIRKGFLTLIADSVLRANLVAAGRNNARRYTLEAASASYCSLYRRLSKQ